MENEKRLIDANEVIRCMQSVIDEENNPNSLGCRVMREIIKGLELTPTVDAVEVVHGRWVSSGCGFDCCSECLKVYADGYLTAMGIKPRMQFNYCPNCGAKMDGGDEDG